MPYDDEDDRAPEQEGVRLIGAEEAEQALERDDVAHRRDPGELRFGDRPEPPPVEGPRPTIRFPLGADEDPDAVGGARPAPAPAPAPEMPHWTEPPTGQVPRIFAAEDLEDDDAGTWSSFTTGQPRWRGEGPQLDEGFDDFSRLADDETRVGALADDDRPGPQDFFAFDDEDDPRAAGGRGWDEPAEVPVGGWDDDYDDDPYAEPVGRTRAISSDPRRTGARRAPTGGGPVGGGGGGGYQRPAGAGRNVPVAIGVGLGFAAVALLCFYAGPTYAAALVTVVLGVAAAELFNVLRQAGYQPATLLGLAATVALPLAAYNKGEVGIPLVLFLTVTFGLVWYLAGAGGEDRPVIGLSSTLFGVGWVGLLGCFAALMVADLRVGGFGEHGIGVLLVAIIGAVGYDVGGFAVGRNAGTRPLSAASPNKTIEGLLGGLGVALVATLAASTLIYPFNDETDLVGKVVLGLGIALAATLGDLCESLVKRDLDVKDMGSVLPEHGGFLDRFDSLLFVLPTVYYLARVLLT